MKIIVPAVIDDTILTSSDVPETDVALWLTATAYSIGDRRMETTVDIHTIYECVQAHTSDATKRPSAEVDSETGIGAHWIRVSATNKWAMFSDQISDQTEQATAITVTLTPGEVVNAIALFNLSGSEVTIEMDDPTDGIVYSETISLVDNSDVTNWYEYYFNPIRTKSDIAKLDLPPYSTADINVLISAPTGTAKCGLLTLGYQRTLGVAEHGTSIGIMDYSRKELDTFGRPIIRRRNYSKVASYKVFVETNKIDFIQSLLGELRTTPVTWVGSEDYGATIIYGYYKDFDILFRNPINSPATIEVEGLT